MWATKFGLVVFGLFAAYHVLWTGNAQRGHFNLIMFAIYIVLYKLDLLERKINNG